MADIVEKRGWLAMVFFVATFWFALVIGVSFLATTAKFLAPSLTLPVALDVGQFGPRRIEHHRDRAADTEWLFLQAASAAHVEQQQRLGPFEAREQRFGREAGERHADALVALLLSGLAMACTALSPVPKRAIGSRFTRSAS